MHVYDSGAVRHCACAVHAMQFSAWRVQRQTAFYSVLLLANPSIQRNLRMMSVQDQEETDPLSFSEVQQAWIERLVAAKISEAASTSTATSMSDIAVSSGASVVSTSSGTTVTAATIAVHGGIGEYSVILKIKKKWEGTMVTKTGPETGGIQVKLYLVSMATVGRRLNGRPR